MPLGDMNAPSFSRRRPWRVSLLPLLLLRRSDVSGSGAAVCFGVFGNQVTPAQQGALNRWRPLGYDRVSRGVSQKVSFLDHPIPG